MLVFADRSDVDVFRRALAVKGVQRVFARHRLRLQFVFRRYAAEDQHGEAAAAANMETMNEKRATT